MYLQNHSGRVGIACLSAIVGLCALLGCSKAKAPPPVITVRLATVTTNAGGDVMVQLSITNQSASAVLVGVRSAVYRAQDSWVTNFDIRPLFVGVTGPGSAASDVTLAAGDGVTAALSPIQVARPFQLEFVCFPSRTGVGGVVDDTKDKFEQFKDGSPHESFLGDSFFVLSPLIDPQTEPDGAANRSQPIRAATNQTSGAAGSDR
jgi:hypothetical protein